VKRSAGLLVYRSAGPLLQCLLAHPGGPFWARRDHGAWTLPKGEPEGDEDPLAAARREFEEETGMAPAGPFLPLGEIRQKGGKAVQAWAVRGEFDPAALRCNTVEIEWPPRSGRKLRIPEIDRVEWFSLEDARRRILAAQAPFLDRLAELLQ
jgi:predicted NUDIX family NTP pyrophosphohydrolase